MDRQLLHLCNRWEFDTHFYDDQFYYDNDDAQFYDHDDDAAHDYSANETDKPLCASLCVIWNGLKC